MDGTSLVALKGDWRCDSCNTNNFAKRLVCYTCRKSRYPVPSACSTRNCELGANTSNNNNKSSLREDVSEKDPQESTAKVTALLIVNLMRTF